MPRSIKKYTPSMQDTSCFSGRLTERLFALLRLCYHCSCRLNLTQSSKLTTGNPTKAHESSDNSVCDMTEEVLDIPPSSEAVESNGVAAISNFMSSASGLVLPN